MREDSRARLTHLLKQHSGDEEVLDHSVSVGKYLTAVKMVKKKYRRNEITLLDIYEYYRAPLSVYTSKKIRNVFVTASLCLTVYLTSNITSLRDSRMPTLGMNFSSTTLVVGTVFVLKEVFIYVINLRKMISTFYMYRYILDGNTEDVDLRRVVKGIVGLEREVHRRRLSQEDVRNIINYERFLLLLTIRRFPAVFSPVCSKFLLYVLRIYIHRIREGSLGELEDEMRVVSVAIFILSPVISIFFVLYYATCIIEKSQNNVLYAFRRVYKPTFKYLVSRKMEYPHETQRRVLRSARYLNSYFQVGRRGYVVGICSALSFLLSCSIFFIIYLILSTILTSSQDIDKSLYQDIRLFGRTTNIVYLFYFIGGISCCLRCLNFSSTTAVGRRKAFAKWSKLMGQETLPGHSRNRRYLTETMSRFFVPRLQLFATEIVSPFVVPFQLAKVRRELESIRVLFNSVTTTQRGYCKIELDDNEASILDP